MQRGFDSSFLSQAALDIYIKNGMFDRHKYMISRQYATRLEILRQAIDHYDTKKLIQAPDITSGVYVHFKVPQRLNLDRVIRRLAERNVLVTPGKAFYLPDWLEREKMMRISVSRAEPKMLEEGIRLIVNELYREVDS